MRQMTTEEGFPVLPALFWLPLISFYGYPALLPAHSEWKIKPIPLTYSRLTFMTKISFYTAKSNYSVLIYSHDRHLFFWWKCHRVIKILIFFFFLSKVKNWCSPFSRSKAAQNQVSDHIYIFTYHQDEQEKMTAKGFLRSAGLVTTTCLIFIISDNGPSSFLSSVLT